MATGRATHVVDRFAGESFDLSAPEHRRSPLKLAAQLVQEDFVLLDQDGGGGAYRFVGGCALFSFMEIGLRGEKGNMKLGEPMPFIHTNVPGFNDPKGGVGAKVAAFFAQLAAARPYYRTNWLLVHEAGLDPMRYSLEGERAGGGYLPVADGAASGADGAASGAEFTLSGTHLRVEFQSISPVSYTHLTLPTKA